MTQCIKITIVYSIFKFDPAVEEICYCVSGNNVNTIKNYMKKHGKGAYDVFMYIFNEKNIHVTGDPAKQVEIGDPGVNYFISIENFIREPDRREKYYVDYMGIVYLLDSLCTVDEVTE